MSNNATAAVAPPSPDQRSSLLAGLNTFDIHGHQAALHADDDGGAFAGVRHYVPGRVPAPIDEPETVVEDAQPSTDCDALDNECESHVHDHGEIIHCGPTYTNDLADLRAFHLEQWGDDAPHVISSGGGTWPDLGLPEVDAVIAAVEKQLAALRDSRAHLAAALGVAPPTQPPEQQKARPANGGAGEQVAE